MGVASGIEYLPASTGIENVKPFAYPTIDLREMDEVRAAIAILGAV